MSSINMLKTPKTGVSSYWHFKEKKKKSQITRRTPHSFTYQSTCNPMCRPRIPSESEPPVCHLPCQLYICLSCSACLSLQRRLAEYSSPLFVYTLYLVCVTEYTKPIVAWWSGGVTCFCPRKQLRLKQDVVLF